LPSHRTLLFSLLSSYYISDTSLITLARPFFSVSTSDRTLAVVVDVAPPYRTAFGDKVVLVPDGFSGSEASLKWIESLDITIWLAGIGIRVKDK
jgi:hypothetical protein